MTIKSENPLRRYVSGQKSVMDGQTEGLRTDNAKTISPWNLLAGDNQSWKLQYY